MSISVNDGILCFKKIGDGLLLVGVLRVVCK